MCLSPLRSTWRQALHLDHLYMSNSWCSEKLIVDGQCLQNLTDSISKGICLGIESEHLGESIGMTAEIINQYQWCTDKVLPISLFSKQKLSFWDDAFIYAYKIHWIKACLNFLGVSLSSNWKWRNILNLSAIHFQNQYLLLECILFLQKDDSIYLMLNLNGFNFRRWHILTSIFEDVSYLGHLSPVSILYRGKNSGVASRWYSVGLRQYIYLL